MDRQFGMEADHFITAVLSDKPLAVNGVARIFVWGATRSMSPGRLSVISRSRPDLERGGGVVAEIFRDLRKRTTFAGGGGGCSGRNFFRYLQVNINQIP